MSEVAELFSMKQGCSVLTFIVLPKHSSPPEARYAASLDVFQK